MKKYMAAFLFALLFPFLVTWSLESHRGAAAGPEKTEDSSGRTILLSGNGNHGNSMSLEEFLAGALAAEISPDFSMETLKAQAVLLRTGIASEMGAKPQIYAEELDLDSLSKRQMRELWGKDGFQRNYERLKKAGMETEGKILTWEGEPVFPLSCFAAAGKTRDGGEAYPYLKAVETTGEEKWKDYQFLRMWTPEQLSERLFYLPDGNGISKEEILSGIGVSDTDDSGYVSEVQIGSKKLSGDEFQDALELPSPYYRIEMTDGWIRVTGCGKGHGYGLSRLGAEKMAGDGKNFEEILLYYFPGTEISDF